jgi:uncharacterized protein (DUF2141 family)
MGTTARLMTLFLVVLLLAPPDAAAETGRLEVVVTNLQNTRGHVRVGICPQQTFLQDDCPYEASGPATAGETLVIVTGIPPGTYAAQVFHDENDNDKVDRSWFGIPTEGVGFSNNPSFTFGPPSFADAAFRLGAEGGRITVMLRHFD